MACLQDAATKALLSGEDKMDKEQTIIGEILRRGVLIFLANTIEHLEVKDCTKSNRCCCGLAASTCDAISLVVAASDEVQDVYAIGE